MVIFYDAIKVQTVKEFYKNVTEEVRDLPEDGSEKVDVYFSTPGGLKYLVPVIYGVLNKYESRINLILTNEMCSSGFDLLYMLRKKEIWMGPEFTLSMTHKGSMRVDIQNEAVLNLATAYTEKDFVEWQRRYKKLGLTKQELKDLSSGADVYFDRERTLQLFPNIKEINYYE
jgi:hypothetical protein